MPAVNPDVTILHAQRADRRGNVAIDGIVGAAREAGLAATRLLVTVEKIVDELPPAMNNVVLPHFTVTAVSHCPGGAWPSYAHGDYARDNDFYLKWDAIARERGAVHGLDRPPRARNARSPRSSSPACGRLHDATCRLRARSAGGIPRSLAPELMRFARDPARPARARSAAAIHAARELAGSPSERVSSGGASEGPRRTRARARSAGEFARAECGVA